jgi:hypothetical protein
MIRIGVAVFFFGMAALFFSVVFSFVYYGKCMTSAFSVFSLLSYNFLFRHILDR